MLIGVIADDFTGASDIANTLAKGGLSTMQFMGLPDAHISATCEAGVVALKSRSIDPTDAVAQSLQTLEWLQRQGCQQFVFKYCSTFDSTPKGNIGPVGEALAKALGVGAVPACPAFPTAGRTVYQGHLFVGDRLLHESGLENHPLNPMTDADIRRWLAHQAQEPVGLVPWFTVSQGPAAVRDALDGAAQRGERLVIVDAISDQDLVVIGEACADKPLVTGGSGIAVGLPRNFIRKGLATGSATAFAGQSGPEAILAGSCSQATLKQVESHCRSHPGLSIPIDKLMSGNIDPSDLADFIHKHAGNQPIVYSSVLADELRRLQAAFGKEAVSKRLDWIFAETAQRIVEGGVRRLVVAGGETSGAVMSSLGIDTVAIGPEIDPGVPALAACDGRQLALALKSGNFGGVDFFERALQILGTRT